jgi:hypothetical protein
MEPLKKCFATLDNVWSGMSQRSSQKSGQIPDDWEDIIEFEIGPNNKTIDQCEPFPVKNFGTIQFEIIGPNSEQHIDAPANVPDSVPANVPDSVPVSAPAKTWNVPKTSDYFWNGMPMTQIGGVHTTVCR